jgi:hypothetical protein
LNIDRLTLLLSFTKMLIKECAYNEEISSEYYTRLSVYHSIMVDMRMDVSLLSVVEEEVMKYEWSVDTSGRTTIYYREGVKYDPMSVISQYI